MTCLQILRNVHSYHGVESVFFLMLFLVSKVELDVKNLKNSILGFGEFSLFYFGSKNFLLELFTDDLFFFLVGKDLNGV